MKSMKPSEILARSGELLEGAMTKDKYAAAVPMIFDLRTQAASMMSFAKQLREAADDLVEATAGYACEHPKALDTPLSDWKDGIRRGTVEIGGVSYALTVSPGAVKRLSGGNMTQKFLAELPKGWAQPKLELCVKSIADVPAAKLAEHDLMRETKRNWTEA